MSLTKSILALGAVLAVVPVRAQEARLPIEVFFRDAEISLPRLSQDGSRVVFLMRNAPARKSIAVYDGRTKKGSIVFVPNDYNVDFAAWKGDRIVFGGDVGGNESYALRSIKADGSSLRDLSESTDRYRTVNMREDGNVVAHGSVLSLLRDDPDHILVVGSGTRRTTSGQMYASGEYGLYRLNVGSGRRLAVERWADHATNYLVDDRSGRVYGRIMLSGKDQAFEIKTPDGDYRHVRTFSGADIPWNFIGLLPGERQAILHVRGENGHDRGALYAFDREQLKLGELLYQPEAGEIVGLEREKDGRIVGVTRETEKIVMDWFDPAWAKLYASLRATFPGMEVAISDSTDDRRVHVVQVYSDRDPGAYYLFDAATPTLTLIGRVNSAIDPQKMAKREPIVFTARDGLQIHGYLTRPVGSKGPHPLIVIPHGGPFGLRDSFWFDPEAQYLANRGYAVIQVNYRGSGGYGRAFQAAGKRQWGRAMQDDLTDAVHWAVKQGVTTADQVGICGASYGGYATLAGLTFTPELYRCGANYVGVSDLRLIKAPTGQSTAVSYDVWVDEWIGSKPEDIRAQSPVEFVEKIRVPSLHAYGENDPRVDIGHWRLLERELKKHKKPYVYIREQNEGHGFEDEKSRIRLYTELEKFLAQHLPPRESVN